MTKPSKLLATALFGAAVGFFQPASAVTIDIIWDDGSKSAGTVDCGGLCQGFTGDGTPLFPTSAGTLSSTEANFYGLTGLPGGQSVESETQALNILISGVTTDPATTPFSVADAVKDETPTSPFFSLAEYFLLKLGKGSYFFHINGGAGTGINISFTEATGSGIGAGLSHITEWGVIPLPAALPMFLLALGGLGYVGRRRKQAAA